ncbi:MAG: hypothetical protein HY804_10540 [Nitrospinae bacterium]|nr:hypothetical protein [Nitrospinota bacterium]
MKWEHLRADLKSEFKKLDAFRHAKNYLLAIDRLNELLNESHDPEEIAWILRERSSYYFLLSDDEKAVEDTIYIIENLTAEVRDYFSVGDALVKWHEYEKALVYLNYGIIKSCDDNNMYYYDTLLFLKAFALIKLHQYDQASEALENMDPTCKGWIDRPCKPYTKEELLRMMQDSV